MRLTQPREVLEGGRLKGGMFRSHLSWVREHHPDRIDDLWKVMPPEIAKGLSGTVLPGSWYPFAWLIQLDRSIARLFGEESIRHLGEYSARINLSTTYRMLDRDTNHAFFRNSALLHRQFQDFGDVEYVERPGGGAMIHRNYPCYSVIFCQSAPGYYEASILSHGAKKARVVETECQCYGEPSCTFEMTWS